MATTGPWVRVLLLVALILGVLAMHSVVAPVGAPPCATAEPHASAFPSGAPSRHHDCGHSAHQLLHLCLAVMAATLWLVLAMAVTYLSRRRRITVRVPTRAVPARSRPPPRTATRLARLCVLRT